MSGESKRKYKLVDSKFKMHSFSSEISHNVVLFQVLQMTNSVMIFINYKDERNLTEMALALHHPQLEKPICTKLMGDLFNIESTTLATKVSAKLNKQVYVSYNVPLDRCTISGVEKELFRQINSHLDKF